jgi:hypothetical protein
MQSEARHVNPDMLSGITKTEQTNVWVTVAWRALAGRWANSL